MVSAHPSAGSEAASILPPASLAGTPLFSMPEDGLSVLASAAEMATQEPANRSGVSPSPQLTPHVWAPPIPQGWMGSCDVPDKIRKHAPRNVEHAANPRGPGPAVLPPSQNIPEGPSHESAALAGRILYSGGSTLVQVPTVHRGVDGISAPDKLGCIQL